MRLELSRAIVFAKDLTRMVTFYRDTLGLLVIEDKPGDGWVEFAVGSATMALHAIPSSIASGIALTDPPRPREESATKLVFRVEDVAAERSRLQGCGVRVSEIRSWDAFDITDPEGNIFQIAKR